MKTLMQSQAFKAWTAWGLVAVLWGSTYPVLRIAVQVYPPEFFAASRFVLAGGAFLLLALATGRAFPRTLSGWAVQGGIGVLNLVLCHGLIIYSAQYVLSGLLALLLALSPAFSALMEWWGGKRLSLLSALGLGLGLVGVGLLAMGSALGGQALWIGAVVLAAWFLALGSALSQNALAQKTDLWVASGLQMSIAGIGLYAVSGMIGEWPRVGLHLDHLWTLVYLALFGSMVAYSAFVYCLKTLGPVLTGTYTYANIAVATLLAWVMLGETLSLAEILALVLIACAIWMVQKGRQIRN